ncbi:MAG: class I mannose-6-phosphate isomerase [Planctomycetes bacterium]|nr:class I mannose-6-phosphate isomerase [Planctomycetota bacterium]
MARPYPLLFRPILKEKIWGGRRLASLAKHLPANANVGESWELADLDRTSVSGGGGGAQRSVIINGEFTGRTIHDALRAWGADLLGPTPATPDGSFPLLVKYLDAREHLSVQVHPSADYAAAHPEVHLKTEAWYVVDAEPGSVVYAGIKEGVSPDAFAAHIKDGTCVDDLIAIPARPGQLYYLPSGTCHALGAGLLVAEVQTPSDTTFRVYDWASEYGRTGRELHVEQALACIDFGPAPDPVSLPAGERSARLLDTEFFTIDEARLDVGDEMPVGMDGRCCVLMVIAGGGELTSAPDLEVERLDTGDTMLVPAALSGGAVFVAGRSSTVLRAGLR